MKTDIRRIFIIGFFIQVVSFTYGQEELKIWNEFIGKVRDKRMTVDMIRPIDQLGDKSGLCSWDFSTVYGSRHHQMTGRQFPKLLKQITGSSS